MSETGWAAVSPAQVFEEYRRGVQYKASLGERGLYRQNEINKRFYSGDQWHGAACGNERPLVRHNVIRRIGEYKMAAVGAQPVAVNFSAGGYADTAVNREALRRLRGALSRGETKTLTPRESTEVMLSALTGYFRTTAERVGFDMLRERILRNAYCTGTGVLYTYWDEAVVTGLFADEGRTVPLKGDIACEVLDIEHVYFGDPSVEELQAQPYILVAQRRTVRELRRMAEKYGQPADEIAAIRPDREGRPPSGEPEESGKALLITKFYKDTDEQGHPIVKAVQVCQGATVRGEWELGIRLYPLSVFCWQKHPDCAYGDSEVTWLIPNQIAINRMLTASVWAVLTQGMPTLLVNGDIIDTPVSNDPGQVIRVFGNGDDLNNAMRYVDPPSFSSSLTEAANRLITETLTQSGANAAALGDIDPNNTSAIMAVREATMMPLQTVRNRFYAFCEEVARLWAEFWICSYGERALRVYDEWGEWYLPFDGDRYRDLAIRARVDVGPTDIWNENRAVETLGALLERGVVTPKQYLERLPRGVIADVDGLLREQTTEVAYDRNGSL